MDRDRYLEIAVTYAENANYLICFQDKTYIQLFLLVLKTVLKNEVIFLQRIILILKQFLGKIYLCSLLSV